ncbi:MAG: VWA domain-containing protein [Acidimicrobiia bacterium]
MLTLLTGFVQELRSAGVPASMVEAIDAMEALRHVDLSEREALRETLRATMVKNQRHEAAFDTAFDVYFALALPMGASDGADMSASPLAQGERQGGGSGGGEVDLEGLIEALFSALRSQDLPGLRDAARRAVDELAGMEPGRPVGGTYYLYRTLRRLDVEGLEERLLEAALADAGEVDGLERRLIREEVASLVERLREEIRAEIRRRLVADRGREPVARTLRSAPVEEIDLMHAGRAELRQIEDVIEPLTRKLAARLARRRLRTRDGRLDFRKTMRASLASGGVPMEPRFRVPRPHRPEIVLLCDISGSMATFARFTLQFTFAMATQFSRLRAFVFVDAVDEVTGYLKPGVDFADALSRIGAEADVVWLDGHSDYGHALEQFTERFGRELSPRSTVIIAGDARNNYREPRSQNLAEIAASVGSVYWLNPEPRPYWDSGDSVMSRYAPYCDGVYEVRNLRQLEAFVEQVAARPRSAHRPRNRSSAS